MEPKKIFVILSLVLVTSIALISLGIVYAGGVKGIGLLGIWFFLTFGIVVVLAQLIPAGILLSSFFGTAFFPSRKAEVPIRVT
jgi:hypothetical protein